MKKKLKKVLSIFLVFIIVFILPVGLFNLLFPLRYRKEILEYSSEFNIERSLVASIIFVESRYNKNAKSAKGALGLMQIIPTTALAFSEDDSFSSKDLFDPEVNIKIGCKFLKYLFDKHQDEVMVLACYNAGEGVVRSWLNGEEKLQLSQIKYEETYNYVNKVIKVKNAYKIRFY